MLTLGIIIGGFLASLLWAISECRSAKKESKAKILKILENGNITYGKESKSFDVVWNGNQVYYDGKEIWFKSCWGTYEYITEAKSKFGLKIISTVREKVIKNMVN